MKTSKSLIFIVLLSVFALLAAACTGNTGNIPQPSGSDTLPSGTASDTGSSITGTPPTEETPAGTEAPVTGTEPGSDTIADVTTVPASTSIEPPPETTPEPAPETTAEPAHETTAAPQPETTAEPESGTAAPDIPETTGCQHSWTAATCTEPRTCTKCGATDGKAAGHKEKNIPGTPATCSAEGTGDSVICSVCGEYIVKPSKLPRTDHRYTITVKGPTSQTGHTVYECKTCGYTHTEDIVPPLNNDAPSLSLSYRIDPDGVCTLTSVYEVGSDGIVTIPSEVYGYKVTVIGRGASSYRSKVKTVIIPDTVTTIEYSAFEGCENLTEIMIPESVTSIGTGAFRECKALKSLKLPSSIKEIPAQLFADSGIEHFEFPEGTYKIGHGAFSSCTSLKEIVIPRTVTVIEDEAFQGCTLFEHVFIPSSLKTIGSGLFEYCTGLKTAVFEAGLTTTGERTFRGCTSLEQVTLSPEIRTLGANVFASSGFVYLRYPRHDHRHRQTCI